MQEQADLSGLGPNIMCDPVIEWSIIMFREDVPLIGGALKASGDSLLAALTTHKPSNSAIYSFQMQELAQLLRPEASVIRDPVGV